MKHLSFVSSLLFVTLAACGDNTGDAPRPDGSVTPTPDDTLDAPSYIAPTPFAIAISSGRRTFAPMVRQG